MSTPAFTTGVVEVPLPGRSPARIHTYTWSPAASPRALVVIAHGAGEHGRRYDTLARDLAAAGFATIAFDNLGHGQTANPDAGGDGLAALGRGGNLAAVRVVVAVLEHARQAHPGTPIVLHGHSWGSLLAQRVFARRSRLVDGLMLSGTALALPGFLNPRDLDAPWRPDASGLQWLSRDPAVRDAFAADPLCFDIAERAVWSPLESLQLVSVPPSAVAGRVDDVPVLILAGSNDTIGYGGRGPRALARAYRRRSALSDVTCTVFDDARHEVFNETNRDEVVAHAVEWLATRFGGRGPEAAPAKGAIDAR